MATAGKTLGDYWQDVCPASERSLLDEHRRLLEADSRIDPAIIQERGYHSLQLSHVYELVNLGVLSNVAMRAEGWLAIPTFRPDGTKYGEVIRLFGHGLGSVKYLWPSSHHLTFDVHPSTFAWMDDPTVDILITEGIKKADALLSAARREGLKCVVISASGNYGWRTKTAFGGTIAVSDFYDIDWKDRRVYIIPDSDFRSNNQVAYGWSECAAYVEGKTGPHRTFMVVVPAGEDREKRGADDYLATGATLESLLARHETREYSLTAPRDAGEPLAVTNLMEVIAASGEKIPHLLTPLIPDASIMLVAGHTGTFKTWAILTLCLDGALGMTWLDHPRLRVERGPFTSIYVNKEMSGLIMGHRAKLLLLDERYKHIPGWEEQIAERVHVVNEADLDLNNPIGLIRLEQAIIRMGAKLVVLDSLSMSWHGDENSASEVGLFYTALRAVTERTGVTWVLIHHLLKPSSHQLKKGDPITSSIRGSGQLTQQADVALMLANQQNNDPDDERLIAVTHAKARTDIELPAWVVRFSTNDGLFASMRYLCSLADAKAKTAATFPDTEKWRLDWLLEACKAMSGMAVHSSGMDSHTLFTLLQDAWTVPDKKPPSVSTLRRDFQKLLAAGCVERVGRKGNHDTYRLMEIDDDGPEPTAYDQRPRGDPASEGSEEDEADLSEDL